MFSFIHRCFSFIHWCFFIHQLMFSLMLWKSMMDDWTNLLNDMINEWIDDWMVNKTVSSVHFWDYKRIIRSKNYQIPTLCCVSPSLNNEMWTFVFGFFRKIKKQPILIETRTCLSLHSKEKWECFTLIITN